MSGVLEGMDGIAPADVAARWHARLIAPDCTLREREKFEAWLGQSPENLLAFEEAKALWVGLDGLEDDEVLAPHVVAALEPEADPFMAQWTRATEGVARARPAPRRRRWLAMAASVATTAILAVVLWPSARVQAPPVPYAATDSIESVRLADGSVIALDLDTAVAARIDSERRSLELQRGRAVFDVARDASRPFVVDAGVGTVTALGTRFQVQRSGEHVSVTLLEGAVGISTAARSTVGGRMLRLVPGQTARYAPETASWSVEAADAPALTSWSEGFHVFGATPLGQAIADINRYSDVTLVLAGPDMESLPVSGSFKLGDGKAVAEALPYALPVKTEARDGKIVISRR
ncbi:FecR family protein [Luteimonas sp. 22616]|uniref:FecR family protein n=1 Tax=Luteimonas sp. 22616 TaxID=3453951 RepID=UPI003F853FC5